MNTNPSIRILASALALLAGLGLSSCAVYDSPYPPSYRPAPPPAVVYYDYWYYPDIQVYFDFNRRVYFYFTDNRWYEVAVLPPHLRARLGVYVPIRSRYTRPYIEYHDHNRHYPPGYRHDHRPPEPRDDRHEPPVKYPRDYNETPRKEPRYEYDHDNRHDDRSGSRDSYNGHERDDRRGGHQDDRPGTRDSHNAGRQDQYRDDRSGDIKQVPPQPRAAPAQQPVTKEPVRRESHEQPRKEPKDQSHTRKSPKGSDDQSSDKGDKQNRKQPKGQDDSDGQGGYNQDRDDRR